MSGPNGFGILGPELGDLKRKILAAKASELPKLLEGLGGEILSLVEGDLFIDTLTDLVGLRKDITEDEEYCEPDTYTVASGPGFSWWRTWFCAAVFKNHKHLHISYTIGYSQLSAPRIHIKEVKLEDRVQ